MSRLATAAVVLLLAGSVAAQSQQPVKIPRVGVLRPGNPPPGDFGQREAFEGGLRDLGRTPGTTILIEYRYAEGKPERLPELASELVRLPVDVIVASSPPGVREAQQATRTIPIVMSTLPDPVGEGFVASLARPGGNTTGLTFDAEELGGKQIELLKEAVPNLSRVAVMRNPASPGYDVAKRQIEAAARALKLEVKDFPVSRPEDLAPTFAAMSQTRVGAILVRRDVLVIEPNRAKVVALAAQRRLPAMYNFRQFPDSGGLMSYSTNVNDIHRRSAAFVDKILKGAKPGDLPIEQPTKFELVHQCEDSQGARPHDPTSAAGASGPGHRVMRRCPTSRFSGPGLALLAPAAERGVGQTSGIYHGNDDPSGSLRLRWTAYQGRVVVRFAISRLATAAVLLLLAAPLAAKAQHTTKIPRVGVLLNSPGTENLRDLHQGLRELGYTEGQTIVLDVQSAEGTLDRLPTLAAELVRRKVDVIVASGPQGVRAARRATGSIPIVMGRMDDVDVHGFVTNLARPGGNITGLSFQTGELAGQLVQLLKEAVPGLSRLAVIWDETGTRNQVRTVQEGARALGLDVRVLELRGGPALNGVVSAARTGGADGLVLMASPGITLVQGRLAKLALQSKLPAIYYNPGFAEAGGLLAYGPKASDFNWRRAAVFVDKILRGAKPADLPIEQPTQFELIINMKTAKVLGLTIPQSLLLQAERIIEQ